MYIFWDKKKLICKYITNFILNLGGQTMKIIDKGSIELLGPFGFEKLLVKFSKQVTNLNTGNIPIYSLFIFVGFISYCFIFYLQYIYIVILIIMAFLGSVL